MAVKHHERRRLASALRGFLQGTVSSKVFRRTNESINHWHPAESAGDKALLALDFQLHFAPVCFPAIDHAVSVTRDEWRWLVRCIVFLHTDLEYSEHEWEPRAHLIKGPAPFSTEAECAEHLRTVLPGLELPEYDPARHYRPLPTMSPLVAFAVIAGGMGLLAWVREPWWLCLLIVLPWLVWCARLLGQVRVPLTRRRRRWARWGIPAAAAFTGALLGATDSWWVFAGWLPLFPLANACGTIQLVSNTGEEFADGDAGLTRPILKW